MATIKPPQIQPSFTPLNSFNIEQGLQYVGGDPKLYAKLLQQFSSKSQTLVEQLQQHTEQGDYAAAIRLVHSLKSTSATLGCTDLQNRAQALEQSLRQHTNYFDLDTFTALVNTLGLVLSELATWQATQSQADHPKATLDAPDWPVILQQVQQMQTALDTDLGAAQDCLKYFQEALQNHHSAHKIVNTLATAIDDFKADRAQVALQTLAQLAKSHTSNG
ncbi:MAG: Hpt domain-containing protein [Leptolyngbya sp. SIOISBB]|nr:Hpt domain-containing protein [Leptolyngbya sp. SIOISBB]